MRLGRRPGPPVRLADDLLVVDPLEELAGERDPRLAAAPLGLVEEGVRDELEALLDQLVVDLALTPDLVGRLELRGEPRLELAEPDVVEPGGVDVVPGDAPVELRRQSSTARSTAQWEWGELSTGTSTSRYIGTSGLEPEFPP
jgi:hypothetical protein